ncbi:MAG: putative Ig domain-containing protein [Spirochaetales bacterium]|nr:putative Ig domain-containing protein [Spirochaetales bacterium]
MRNKLFISGLLILLVIAAGCEPPVPPGPQISITTTTLPAGLKGAAYAPFVLQASNGDPAAYSWQVTAGSLPAGMTLSVDGELSGTPTASGTFTFTVQVADGSIDPGSKEFSLNIGEIGVSPSTLPSAQYNSAYSQTLTGSNGTAPYAFAVTAGFLPDGLSLASGGTISGTPSAYGSFDFTVHVTDANGAYTDHDYTVPVYSGVAVAIQTGACPNGFINGAYSVTLTATGGQGTYAWSLSSGSLPAGLSLGGSSGSLTGTTTAVGTYDFTVRATDTVETGNYDEQAYTVIVRSAVAVSTTSLPDGITSVSYSSTAAASGGSGSYTWSVASGSLPAGLSLTSATGEISGTPSAAGTSNFTLRATDNESSGNYDDQALSITVVAKVQIQTATLPSIGANKSYDQTLSSTGGTGGFSWSISSGSLPLDVALGSSSGQISGYPSRPGTYNFTVRCEDSANSANYDTQALSLTVTNCEWTILVYLDGDNNLEQFAFDDINEMEYSDLRGTGVKLIVLMDGISGYYSGTSAFTDTRLFEIQYDSAGYSASTGIISRQLASTELGLTTTAAEELNMGDPTVLSNFINFGKTAFPADNYAVVLWDHGSGWRASSSAPKRLDGNRALALPGFNGGGLPPKPATGSSTVKAVCLDDTSGDIMYTQEIGTGLAGKGVGIVCFDICYSAMMEIAYEIRSSVDIMIASEETVPGTGYVYDEVLNAFKVTSRTTADFYNAAVSAYAAEYSASDGTTISVIDLSEIGNVMTALNAFSTALYNACSTNSIRNEVGNIIFNYAEDYYSVPGDLNIDIYDMADEIYTLTNYADTQAGALMTAIDQAVLAEWHNAVKNPESHGISLYFVTLGSDGYPAGHLAAYDKAYAGSYPLAFCANSTWTFDTSTSTGLLYRLWYEALP